MFVGGVDAKLWSSTYFVDFRGHKSWVGLTSYLCGIGEPCVTEDMSNLRKVHGLEKRLGKYRI